MIAFIPDEKSHRRFERWLLNFIYPVPEGVDGTDYAFNTDLSELTAEEAQAHLARVKLRLLLDPEPRSWLIQRHSLLLKMVGTKNE